MTELFINTFTLNQLRLCLNRNPFMPTPEWKTIKFYFWPQKSIYFFFLWSRLWVVSNKNQHKLALKHLFVSFFLDFVHFLFFTIKNFPRFFYSFSEKPVTRVFPSFLFWRARLFHSSVACNLAVVGKLNMKKPLLARIFFKLSNK